VSNPIELFPPGPLEVLPIATGTLPAAPLFWNIPGSKSITNRALPLAALSEGSTLLTGVLHSDDTLHMRRALEAMGIVIDDVDQTTLRVHGGRSRLRSPQEPLFIGNSGTTVRFLTALAALVPGPVTLVGDEHMQKRPISDLVHGLGQLGVRIDCETGCPPLTIFGGKLPGGTVEMPGDKSSQYFSALLMVAPCAEGPLHLAVAGHLVSRPYVDITLAMMRAFGAAVESSDHTFDIEPARTGYQSRDYAIEPDASSASYAFACAAATGLSVTVPNLGLGAQQGDYAFVDLLEQAGAEVIRGADATTVRGTGRLRGLDVDMHHISDTVMTLAAISPLMDGPTTIRNVENIRIKETDRLDATVAELARLGQKVTSGRDWLRIEPAPITPCVVRSYSDHRMAMAFAVLGLCRPGVSIETPSCVKKTYPNFWQDLRRVYAHVGQGAAF
jgi:3-phosphoshikimate 1-carboxyvinyltransferase